MKSEFLKSREAAEYLGISMYYLRWLTMSERRAIPFYKPNGKMKYFLKSDLDAYMAKTIVSSDTDEYRNKNDVSEKYSITDELQEMQYFLSSLRLSSKVSSDSVHIIITSKDKRINLSTNNNTKNLVMMAIGKVNSCISDFCQSVTLISDEISKNVK